MPTITGQVTIAYEDGTAIEVHCGHPDKVPRVRMLRPFHASGLANVYPGFAAAIRHAMAEKTAELAFYHLTAVIPKNVDASAAP